MHAKLSFLIPQDLRAALADLARAQGFVDVTHYARDLLYKAAKHEVPVTPPKPPSRLAPCAYRIMKALKETNKPMSVSDFIRATRNGRQSLHVNTKDLLDNGLIEVVSQHSDGTVGAPRRYFKPTEAGLSRLAMHESSLKAQTEEITRTMENSGLQLGVFAPPSDPEEAEEIRQVRIKHEARRKAASAPVETEEQKERREHWESLTDDDLNHLQALLMSVVYHKTKDPALTLAQAEPINNYIRNKILVSGYQSGTLKLEAWDELESIGKLKPHEAVDEMFQALVDAKRAKDAAAAVPPPATEPTPS